MRKSNGFMTLAELRDTSKLTQIGPLCTHCNKPTEKPCRSRFDAAHCGMRDPAPDTTDEAPIELTEDMMTESNRGLSAATLALEAKLLGAKPAYHPTEAEITASIHLTEVTDRILAALDELNEYPGQVTLGQLRQHVHADRTAAKREMVVRRVVEANDDRKQLPAQILRALAIFDKEQTNGA